MTLRESRVLYTRLVVDLLLWLRTAHPEWEIAFGEQFVKTPRQVLQSGRRIVLPDAVHVPRSRHYSGEGGDFNLYIDGQYISDGDHPAWKEISRKWESLHPLATAGRRWKDANHLSLDEADKSVPLPA